MEQSPEHPEMAVGFAMEPFRWCSGQEFSDRNQYDSLQNQYISEQILQIILADGDFAIFAQLSAEVPGLQKSSFMERAMRPGSVTAWPAVFFNASATVPGFGSDGGLHGVSEKAEGAEMFAEHCIMVCN